MNPPSSPELAPRHHREGLLSHALFFGGLLAAVFTNPPIALVLGLVFGLTVAHPLDALSRRASKFLLQGSVVGLGFGMSLHSVLRVGRDGFLYTILGITFALAVGMGLGSLLRVRPKSAFLIATGTAICGGSAIAAVGPLVEASDEEMAVSLGTIFMLNAIALLAFPPIGTFLGLTQSQFGLWSALAIHDTSSVVGAASRFGTEALGIATTVKLARALWILPLAVATAAVRRAKAKIQWPWFVGLFCLAAVCATYAPAGAPFYAWLVKLARIGLTLTLYLIGTGISRRTLRQVGPRSLLQGSILWLAVSVTSLWLIRAGWIALR
ncbi:MAG TPA: putative sulfate exporter family transporter [Thermoanaerobaculia bacterium]